MANAYKCDFCGALTEGQAAPLRTEIYGADCGAAHRYQPKFLGSLNVTFKRDEYDEGTTVAEVCPPCIRKFAQRIAEGK